MNTSRPITGVPSDLDGEALTFVFTDIEGSTRLLERLQGAYGEVLATHAELIRDAVARHGGREVDTQGDAFFIVFSDVVDAVRSAAAIQMTFANHPWPAGTTVRIRIGIHAGHATATRTGYVGLDVHHGARVAAAAHGGQVLASGAAAAAIPAVTASDGHSVPPLRSLGRFTLKDIRDPMELFQVHIAGLQEDFPPPRSLDEIEPPPTVGEPPYPGLVHYEESDAERFFGREAIVATLVERLAADGFIVIVGASGSGKSSLVRAGIIPSLRNAAGPPADEARDAIVVMTPTERPLDALEAALAGSAERPVTIAVDQFEELFTLCREERVRTAFVDRLLAEHDRGARLLIVLRADFYDGLAPFERLRTLAAAHQAYIGPLGPEELRATIEGPARHGGWRIAAGLVDLIVHDVGHEPGALPLLSHALRETWLRRRGDQLTLRGYLDSGGVQGAIARTADHVVAGLQGAELDATRAIFIRLTELGEETPDTRRRAPLDELLRDSRDPDSARIVLDRLVTARLVVADDRTAEVAHEALIREWPQLRAWLDEDRESLRMHRTVTVAAREWDRFGRDLSLLLRGGPLARAVDWLTVHAADANALERLFITRSRENADQEAAERQAVARRELEAAQRVAAAERARADEAARSARRLRRGAAVLAGAVVAAVGLAVVAAVLGQQASDNARVADQNEQLARVREIASASDAALARDPELSLLLAIEAVERLPDEETDRRLRTALSASRVRQRFPGQAGAVHSVALDEGGDRVVTAGADGSVRVWNGVTHEQLALVRPDRGEPVSAAMSPDGTRLAAITTAGELWIWTVGTDEHVSISAHAAPGTDVGFSLDGSKIVTAGEDGLTHVWDAGSRAELATLGEEPGRTVYAAALSPDGSRVVTADPGFLGRIWEVATGEVVGELVGHESTVLDAVFSRDGTRIATAGADDTARIWDASTGSVLVVLRGHTGPVTSVAFSADGETVATASEDGSAIAWDAHTGRPIATLRGHSGPVASVALSADGREVTTGGADGTVRVWVVRGSVPRHAYAGFPGAVVDAVMSPDGTHVLAVGADWTARVFDTATERQLVLFADHQGIVLSAAFSPDGESALTVATDGTARVWDVATGAASLVLEPGIGAAAFSPDGTRIATAGLDGTITIWDARTGTAGATMSSPVELASIGWSSDSSLVWTADRNGGILGWDVATGAIASTLAGLDGPASYDTLAVSPDGVHLATAADDATIRVWDISTGSVVATIRGDFAATTRLRYSPDGSWLAAANDDGAARVWDPDTGRLLTTIPSDAKAIYGVAWSSDGTQLLLSNAGLSAATLHACDTCGATATVLAVARSHATRSLSTDERARYLHESSSAIGPTPIASLEPAIPRVVFPDPTAEVVAVGDICTGLASSCELPAGPYRPTRLRPEVGFVLDREGTGIAQGRSALLFEIDLGEVALQDGSRTFGYGTDGLVRMGASAAEFVTFLRDQPLLAVADERPTTVDGRHAIMFTVTTPDDEPADLFYADPLPSGALPDLPTIIVAVDVGDTFLVVQGSADREEDIDAFAAWFEGFVATIDLPGSAA